MALTTIHHRELEHRVVPGIAVAIAVVLAIVAVLAVTDGGGSTSTVDPRSPAPVIATQGPNFDLAPVWGSQRSPADGARAQLAERGPNFDLAPVWGSELQPLDVTAGQPGSTITTTQGPNADLAPAWGSQASSQANRGPNQDLAPAWK